MLTSSSVGLDTCLSRPLKNSVLFPLLTRLTEHTLCIKCLFSAFVLSAMPSEATETVPVTEQEMQQPQVETGSYDLLSA